MGPKHGPIEIMGLVHNRPPSWAPIISIGPCFGPIAHRWARRIGPKYLQGPCVGHFCHKPNCQTGIWSPLGLDLRIAHKLAGVYVPKLRRQIVMLVRPNWSSPSSIFAVVNEPKQLQKLPTGSLCRTFLSQTKLSNGDMVSIRPRPICT
jgi:hypothetical protein